MAMYIANGNDIGSGRRMNLADLDSAYIGASGFVGSTTDAAIYGTGSFHQIRIEGTAVGAYYGIFLDYDAVEENAHQTVVIGENGTVSGAATAIVMYASESYIENNGTITGGSAIYLRGFTDKTSSTIVNNGTIDTIYSPIFAYSNQDITLINNGLIKSSAAVFGGSFADGDMTVVNNGQIIGGVDYKQAQVTGGNNDIYDGREGTIEGLVRGRGGNDVLMGGKSVERLQGDIGRDVLTGGAGADHFLYVAIEDSTTAKIGRDLIKDFSRKQHDILDLAGIDADPSTMDDDALHFIGSSKFSKETGELNFIIKNGSTIVQIDLDGDGKADFAFELAGAVKLTDHDFAL